MSDYSDEDIDGVFDSSEEEAYEVGTSRSEICITASQTAIAQDDDAMSFDTGPTKQKASDIGSAFGFRSLSMHDLQMMVDSEIQDVSNIVGLEVRRHPLLRAE